MTVSPEDILTFWFEEAGPEKWYKKDEDFDSLIRARFGDSIEVFDKELEVEGKSTWEETARGALALVILLDQFPRNIHRGSARAYQYDNRALGVAKRSIEAGYDLEVDDVMRRNFYLPFMHSELLADQDRCVDLTRTRVDSEESLRYAILHRDIVRDFGCFPHRNDVLGRPTTKEQQAFLDKGGFAG